MSIWDSCNQYSLVLNLSLKASWYLHKSKKRKLQSGWKFKLGHVILCRPLGIEFPKLPAMPSSSTYVKYLRGTLDWGFFFHYCVQARSIFRSLFFSTQQNIEIDTVHSYKYTNVRYILNIGDLLSWMNPIKVFPIGLCMLWYRDWETIRFHRPWIFSVFQVWEVKLFCSGWMLYPWNQPISCSKTKMLTAAW